MIQKNLYSRIKEVVPELSSIISDDELLAANRINRMVGETTIVDGFFSMFRKKPNLNLQDYELFSNIPAVLNILGRNRKNYEVINKSRGTTYHALFSATYLLFMDKLSIFVNEQGEIDLAITSKYAQIIFEKLKKNSFREEKEDHYNKIVIVDAKDSIVWNSVLDDFYLNKEIHALIVKNYCASGVFDETTAHQPINVSIIQSLVGYGILFKI